MANSVAPDQTAPISSGSTLIASILHSSVMLGNYLQQTTSADDIFRCIVFCLGALMVSMKAVHKKETLLTPINLCRKNINAPKA